MKLDLLDDDGRLRTLRVQLDDGAATTAHVARFPHDDFHVDLQLVQPQLRVLDWCAQADVDHAMNGGFFTKPAHQPLGELHLAGARRTVRPYRDPWAARRAALRVDAGRARIGSWTDVTDEPLHAAHTHLLQAGPLLVAAGRAVVAAEDPEGFSTTHATEFDSDITAERLPRMAFATTHDACLAVAVDGRAPHDSGLLLPELADLLVELGAHAALNLDGGSSASLVVDRTLRNHPRDDDGNEFERGYPTPLVIAFRSV